MGLQANLPLLLHAKVANVLFFPYRLSMNRFHETIYGCALCRPVTGCLYNLDDAFTIANIVHLCVNQQTTFEVLVSPTPNISLVNIFKKTGNVTVTTPFCHLTASI